MFRALFSVAAVVFCAVGCQKTAAPVYPLSGTVALSVDESVTDAAGKVHPQTVFTPQIKAALEARGLRVLLPAPDHQFAEESVSGLPIQALIKGRIFLAEEATQESRVGGPVPFFFVNGAYDLSLVDPKTGKSLGRLQGPLDVRQLKEKGLPSAHGSYLETVQTIASSAGPKMGNAAAEKLAQLGLLTTAAQTKP